MSKNKIYQVNDLSDERSSSQEQCNSKKRISKKILFKANSQDRVSLFARSNKKIIFGNGL